MNAVTSYLLIAFSFMQTDFKSIPEASGDCIGKILKKKERNRRDRITCLESQSKDFSGILPVLSDLKVTFIYHNCGKRTVYSPPPPHSSQFPSVTGWANCSEN